MGWNRSCDTVHCKLNLFILTLESPRLHAIHSVSASTIPLFSLHPFLRTSTWWRSAEKTQLINGSLGVGSRRLDWWLNIHCIWQLSCDDVIWETLKCVQFVCAAKCQGCSSVGDNVQQNVSTRASKLILGYSEHLRFILQIAFESTFETQKVL